MLDKEDIIWSIKEHFQTKTGKHESVKERQPVRVIDDVAFERYIKNTQNPLWREDPTKNRWLNLLFDIGGNNEVQFWFRNAIDIEFDSKGNLLVLDFGNKSIEVFAAQGKHLRTIGIFENRARAMLEPTDLAVDTKGRIYVSDRKKGILIFRNDGTLLKQLSVPYKIEQIVLDTDANIIALTPMHKFLLHKFNAQGKETLVFAPQDEKEPALRSVFSQGDLTIDAANHFYISFVTPYRIFKYNSQGQPELKFDRELGTPVNPPTIEKRKDGSIKYVFRQQISYEVKIGADGLLYNLVRTKGTKGGNILDVFSRKGEYLQSFYLENPALAFSLLNDQLALISASKPQKVMVYKVMKVDSVSSKTQTPLNRRLHNSVKKPHPK